MIMVKTFTNQLKILQAKRELAELDVLVNKFIQEKNIRDVISVSDTCTAGDGNTIGIIRVLTYTTA